MADPLNFIIPTVGSSGYFELREPFHEKIDKNVRYTCQEIRRISGYVANNEDIEKTIYEANNIADSVYAEDLANDTQIASLQGETGQWVYVPVRYIIAYPNTNGIMYRTISLSVALAAMPVDQDLSPVIASISSIVTESLGFSCIIEPIETSKVTLVDSTKHEATQMNRNIVRGTPTTDRGLYMKTLQQLTDAQVYIAELERYIAENIPPP